MKYCLEVYQIFSVDSLDTLWHTHKITKDLEYQNSVKKFIENGIHSSDLTELEPVTKNGNFYFILLIIIFQLYLLFI